MGVMTVVCEFVRPTLGLSSQSLYLFHDYRPCGCRLPAFVESFSDCDLLQIGFQKFTLKIPHLGTREMA